MYQYVTFIISDRKGLGVVTAKRAKKIILITSFFKSPRWYHIPCAV